MNQLPTFQEYENAIAQASEYNDQVQLLVVGRAIELALDVREQHGFHKITSWVAKYHHREESDSVQCGYYATTHCGEKLARKAGDVAELLPLSKHLQEWGSVIYEFAGKNYADAENWRFEAKEGDSVKSVITRYMGKYEAARYMEIKLRHNIQPKSSTKENTLENWAAQRDEMAIKAFEGLHYIFQKVIKEHHFKDADLWVGETSAKKSYFIGYGLTLKNGKRVHFQDSDTKGSDKALRTVNQYIAAYEPEILNQIRNRLEEERSGSLQNMRLQIKLDTSTDKLFDRLLPAKILLLAKEMALREASSSPAPRPKTKL